MSPLLKRQFAPTLKPGKRRSTATSPSPLRLLSLPLTVPTPTNFHAMDWVKWVAGVALALSSTAFGYALNTEHRLTNTETTVSQHIAESKEIKADIYGRLSAQDQNQKEVLQALNDVKVDMAAIRGALGIPKQTKP